jgi:hypothetical protein
MVESFWMKMHKISKSENNALSLEETRLFCSYIIDRIKEQIKQKNLESVILNDRYPNQN